MNKVIPITEETKRKLLKKSADSLPDRPTQQGYTANQIRKAFFEPIINKDMQDNVDNPSVVSEINRIVNETNEAIGKADATYIGETEPIGTQYKTWLKLEPKEPEIETNMVIDNEIETEPMLNEIESGELTGDEIETEPMLNEIESGELTGDEIITPPQFE